MGFSFAHLVVLMIVVFVLFGAGKLPRVMGDVGRGIKNFRDELQSDEQAALEKVTHKKDQK